MSGTGSEMNNCSMRRTLVVQGERIPICDYLHNNLNQPLEESVCGHEESDNCEFNVTMAKGSWMLYLILPLLLPVVGSIIGLYFAHKNSQRNTRAAQAVKNRWLIASIIGFIIWIVVLISNLS
jgi:hypothetical protein